MTDLGSLEARKDTTPRSLTKVAKDRVRLVGGVNLNKLTIRRPLDIKKFDPKTANLFASEKKWDELKGYLGQFASEDSDDMLNLFIQFEHHVIELVKDVKYVAALSVFKDEIIPSIHASACNNMITLFTDHLLVLQEQVKASMSIFDQDIAIAFINKKDLKGLKKYLKAFIKSNPHDGEVYNHPGLMLTLYELELIEAVDGHNLDLALKMFEDKIKPLKAVSSDEMFRPLDFLRRIQHIESSLKSLKVFYVEYKEERTTALFDYIRLYFCEQFRPLTEADKTLFHFVYKGNAPGPPRCLACGWVIQATEWQKYFEHHVTHSEECKKLKIDPCDGLTPYLSRQVNASYKFKKGEASSRSAIMLALADSSKSSLEKKESGHSGKRRKVNNESESCSLSDIVSNVESCGSTAMFPLAYLSRPSLLKKEFGHSGKRRKVNHESDSCSLSDRVSIVESCEKGDEAISAEKELPEDDPAVVIMSLVTKNVDLCMSVAKLDNSVSAGVSAICKEQNDIIFYLQQLICQQPLDLHKVMIHVSKLEKKNAEFFTFINDLPPMFHSKLLEFTDVTFKLRSVLIRPLCARSVHAPAVCDLWAELVKINLAISMMVKCSAVGSVDEVTKICEVQEEEVVKMVKLFHEDKVDPESLIKLVSSISEVNNRFLPLVEFLPKGLPSKLLDMHAVIFKLWCLCLQ